ncbi:MAG: hypothetical protein J6S21_02265, partial [Victivallales bacterium]|nr:hypothetical protein [Victivallales bacterium]
MSDTDDKQTPPEQKPGDEQPPMGRIAPEGMPPGGVTLAYSPEKITYMQTLWMLMWHPKLGAAFVAARRFFFRGAMLLIVLSMLGGCAHAMLDYGEREKQIAVITDFVLDTLGEVTLTEGELKWRELPADALPAGGKTGDLHFRITDKAMAYQPAAGVDTPHGVVLGHDGIRYWQRFSDDEIYFQDLKVQDMEMLQNTAKMMDGGEKLLTFSKETRTLYRTQIALSTFMVSAFAFSWSTLIMLFSSCALGGIIMAVFGRARTLGNLFTSF